MFIWLNEKMGRGYERGETNPAMLFVIAALAFFAAFMIPLAFTAGVISFLAVKMYELPGLKQAADLLLKLACAKVVKGASDVVAGVAKTGTGLVGGILKGAGGAFKGLGDLASDITGIDAFRDVTGFAADHTVGLLAQGFDATKLGIEQLQKLRDFACKLKTLVDNFKKQGLEQPFKAAISCKNWPEEWGEIDRTSDGKAKYCLEDEGDGDKHQQIPGWLIPIYQRAGEEHNVPWALLAAINWNDTEFGAKPLGQPEQFEKLGTAMSDYVSTGLGRHGFGELFDQIGEKGARELRKKIEEQLKSMSVSAEWQVQNARKNDRVGWIPMTAKEWESVRNDSGSTPVSFTGNPYTGKVACPMPVSGDGALQGGSSSAGGPVGKLPGPVKGMATFYNPALGGINGREGGGSFAPVYRNGWAAARLFGVGNSPSLGHAWHGIMVRVKHLKTGKTIEVPIADIGPGGPPLNGHPRIIDLLPEPSQALTGGKPGTTGPVELTPLRRLTREEVAKYGRGLKKGATSGGGGTSGDVAVSFIPDGQFDTCDPVDSIFALAEWLSDNGVSGATWQAALDQGAVGAQFEGGEEGADVGGDGIIWPTKTKTVSSGFGPRWGRMHQGIDVPVPVGTSLYAIFNGKVTVRQTTAQSGGYGNYTCIQNGSLSACYAHQDQFKVKPGDEVKQGEIIGLSGNTGRSTGPHLHFEIRKEGRPIDPMILLRNGKLPAGGDDSDNATDVDGDLKGFSTAGFPDRKDMLKPNDGAPLKLDAKLKDVVQPTEEHCKSSHIEPGPSLVRIFQAAGKTFNVDWRVLAVITERESVHGCETGRRGDIAGWTGMSDSRWEDYAVDANADGEANRQKAVDSIFGLARYLAARGAPKDYRKALLAFREEETYASEILAAARAMGAGGGIEVALDDMTSDAVQKRNHLINRELCEDEEEYVQCIAKIYRKIEASDPAADSPASLGVSGELGERIVEIARRELKKNVREVPSGSNESPDIRRYREATAGGPACRNCPWCAFFVSYVAKEAGSPIYDGGRGHGAVAELENWAKRTGQWIPKGRGEPAPGDFIVFHTNGNHIGIVETVKNGHVASTIEGNFGNAVKRGGPTREATAAGFIRLKGDGESKSEPKKKEDEKTYGPYAAKVAR